MSGSSIVGEYIEITKEYKNIYGEKTVVFLMVGAFYEIYATKRNNVFYGSSIEEISSVCELNISDKQIKYNNEPVFMCGFRDYTLDKYVIKATDMGFTCIIFDQEPDGKKFKRKMVAKYSPGTVFLNNNNNLSNYCGCIWFHEYKDKLFVGISCLDIFTGKTIIYEYNTENTKLPTAYDDLERFLSIYKPSELIVISPSIADNSHSNYIEGLYTENSKKHIIYLDENSILGERAINCEKQIYIKEVVVNTYVSINYDIFSNLFLQNTISSQSFAFLLNFVCEHNPNLIRNIQIPTLETFENNMLLANHSLKQLNVISSNTSKMGSLYNFINYCKTAMGNRELKEILLHPSCNTKYLQKEYDLTEYLLKKKDFISIIRTNLTGFKDFDKCYRQIILKRITPKTLYDLHKNILSMKFIIDYLNLDDTIIEYLTTEKIDANVENIIHLQSFIERIFDLEKCNIDMLQFDTNIFNVGVFEEIDKHVEMLNNSEKELTAIMNHINAIMNEAEKKKKETEYVKIHVTEKSGMYLVTTKKRGELLISLDKENKYNIRKTSANNQYAIENSIISGLCDKFYKGKNKLKDIIQKYYLETVNELESFSNCIYELSSFISSIDMLQNKCYIAQKFDYSKPKIDIKSKKSYLEAGKLRHPLLEHIQQSELYVTNDISLGINDQDGICLFGTNAVGKTSLIKAIGLNIILAQSGFFTATSDFKFTPYKQLFTRILNNDNMFKGLSTFAVEMCELRTILKMSNQHSLILGDELCSGTENISAVSIFVAGLKYLHKVNSSFIFATHFHEIVNMKDIKKMKKLKMKHLSVLYNSELKKLVYDRKIKDGSGESIYGLEVCKSLFLPDDFLEDAYEIRKEYLNQKDGLSVKKSSYNSKKVVSKNCEFCHKNKASEIHHLQYQKFANNNKYIIDFQKNHTGNLVALCDDCHNNIHENNEQYVKKTSIDGEINIIRL